MMGHESVILAGGSVGFFGMLVIGFLAGWIAERTMNRDHGVLTNILVGIAGSFVGGTAASLVGIHWYGFLGNLVIATMGAIGILWFFGKRESAHKMRAPQQGNWQGESIPGTGEDVQNPGNTPIYHAKNDEK